MQGVFSSGKVKQAAGCIVWSPREKTEDACESSFIGVV